MQIGIILGTRPEIIKLSPIIRECIKSKIDFFTVHTGQHYSFNMDKVFFNELNLSEADYNLEVGSNYHGKQTGRMLMKIEDVLQIEEPDVILVQGDTNSTLAGALAASKLGIDVGHVEAGLRSYDRSMPEEINRVLTDHCSNYLFAPTQKSAEILIKEGIDEKMIFLTGNTIVDAIKEHSQKAIADNKLLDELQLYPKRYILLTAHRQENVDHKERFSGIIEGSNKISNRFGLPVVYPIHPRSLKQMKKLGLQPKDIRLTNPKGFYDFLKLESNARLVLTDSGGVQEETCILGVPCVTLRDNTERPETIEVGSNILSGTKPDAILQCSEKMLDKKSDWKHPFGNGDAGKKIINILRRIFE